MGAGATWLLSTIVVYLVRYRRALACQRVGSRFLIETLVALAKKLGIG